MFRSSRNTRRPRRRQSRRNNNNRSSRNGRVRNGTTQGVTSGSRADTTVQRKAVQMYRSLAVNDSSGGTAYGLGNINIQPNASAPYLAEVLKVYKNTYEQYRIRRVRVYATPGKNFTNDIRIKTQIACRVDRDNLPVTTGPSGLGLLLGSANSTVKTLTERGNVIIADFNPVCQAFESGASTTDGRQLPNSLQWFGVVNYDRHAWKGACCAIITPDEGYLPTVTPTVNLRIRLDLEFRGRIIAQARFASQDITIPIPPPIPELLDEESDESDASSLTLDAPSIPTLLSSIKIKDETAPL